MLDQFFQLGPLPSNAIASWYEWRLVILSYVVATFSSYIALDITARLRDITNTKTSMTFWLVGGAIAFGAGIWSMHFIGMLAFKMDMPAEYQLDLTILSMMVAICASGFALILLKPRVMKLSNYILGGIILGLAIAAMHYTGMAAMTTNMQIRYMPDLFLLSIAIAIFASEAAIWLAIKSTQVIPRMQFRLKIVSAFIMGAAICGMHYTGMAAAIFTPKMTQTIGSAYGIINPEMMAITIAVVTFIILGVAFVASTYKESLNQQLLLTARQAGMAEVAASVLHNVGNVLNSVKVSSSLAQERIKNSKFSILSDLQNLLNENKNHLSQFFQNDPRGKEVPYLISLLSDYWKSEKKELEDELSALAKNVEHIKNIIASQQDLSRVSEFEQVISIENVVEEALLITGADDPKYGIQIEKEYSKLKPVLIDKVKLLQILVNLIQNAKDAVFLSGNGMKKIKIKFSHNHANFTIAVSDSGVGISKDNLTRIFTYGFTTKESGHGFGLHTSAINAKEMAGSLKVTSEGLEKGTTFSLELPYKWQ